MLLVICGAGASYDSNPDSPPQPHIIKSQQNPFRPPLANELFENRTDFRNAMARFPKCIPIIPFFNSLPPERPVERVLEELQIEAESDSERHRQLAALRYYLHFMLWECQRHWTQGSRGISNYRTLVDEIRRCRKNDDEICFVTFNYDTMLEQALTAVLAIEFRQLGDYVSDSKYKMIKLHGSINWGCEVDNSIDDLEGLGNPDGIAARLVELAPELKVSNRYHIVSSHPLGRTERCALFPALAIPVETKRNYICPEDHVAILQKFLPKVSKVLVIGWRATEQIFLEMMSQALPANVKIMLVGGRQGDADPIIQNLSNAGIEASFEVSEEGFTNFVVTRQLSKFLLD